MVKSITVNGVKIEVPVSMVANGGKFEISREGRADPVVIDLSKSEEAHVVGKVMRAAATVGSGFGSNLMATFINRIRSLGTFNTINELEKSVTARCKKALKEKEPASLEDVRQYFKEKGYMISGKGLVGFLSWAFTGDTGTKFEKMFEGSDFKLKNKDGLVIGLAKLRFLHNTMDISGIADQQLVLVNTFIKDKKGKVKAVKVGRCYIRGRTKNVGTAD